MPLASTMVWLQLRLQLMLRSAPAAAASTKSLEECAHSCSRTSAPPTSASAHRMSSSCAATALIAEQQAASARSCLEQAHACTRATPPPAAMLAWRAAAVPAGKRGGGASVTRHKRGKGCVRTVFGDLGEAGGGGLQHVAFHAVSAPKCQCLERKRPKVRRSGERGGEEVRGGGGEEVRGGGGEHGVGAGGVA